MFIWVLFLILTIAAYIGIASVILPRYYLKTRYTVDKSNDRGIKKVLEVNGQSMVFEPEIKWRKYVKQYVLSERDGEKQLTCKVSEKLTYLEMDVVLFNNQDKVFSVLKVKDLVDKKGYTKTVTLPDQTSYVSIVICKADGEQFEDHLTAKVKGGKLFKFLLSCSLIMVMEIMCLKVCCANLFGGVFKESFVLNLESTLVTLAMAVAAIVVNIIVTAIAIKIREVNYVKGNKK